MSSTSNKSSNDKMFVIEGMGHENAYEVLKHHDVWATQGEIELGLQDLHNAEVGDPFFSVPEPKHNATSPRGGMWLAENRLPHTAASPENIMMIARIPSSSKSSGAMRFPEMVSESYMTKAFRNYLDEVDKVEEFADGLVTRQVKRLFILLQKALRLNQIPNPQAMPSEDNALSLVWQDKSYQIEVNIRPDGLIDWFWFNLITDEYEGAEDVSLSSPPLNLLKHLKTAFDGG